jgi:mannose-6-phosphate isomerase-like protein (cupin superfamily)
VTLQGPLSRSARTERGRVVFENIPAGTYRLRYERDGFIPFEQEIAARGRAPIDLKVALTPAPPMKPLPCVTPPAPPPPAPTAGAGSPTAIDIPAFIEKNHVGRDPNKTSSLSCTPGGLATVIQVRDPITEHVHSDADEFLYVVGGAGSVRIGDRVEPLQAGVLMLVPRATPHAITARGRGQLYLLSIRAGEKCGASATKG